MDYAELVASLRTGHDQGCPLPYELFGDICNCSYPVRQTAADAITKLSAERDALRHDIERHVAICAEQAQEIKRLREEVMHLKRMEQHGIAGRRAPLDE